MSKSNPYNFQHFKISHFDFENFQGPKEGEKALNFKASTIDGKLVQLSDHFDRLIVLSFGSYSCPHFAGHIEEMNELKTKYPQAHFLVLYTRETHPGGRVPVHQSMQEKLKMAKKTKQKLGDQRSILVDDLEGSAHKKYGALPNAVYVIDTQGEILYRDEWESPGRIESVLDCYFKEKPIHTDQIKKMPRKSKSGFYHFIKLLKLAGIVSLWDLIKAIVIEVKGDSKKVKF